MRIKEHHKEQRDLEGLSPTVATIKRVVEKLPAGQYE
jgi:hypothetical protein